MGNFDSQMTDSCRLLAIPNPTQCSNRLYYRRFVGYAAGLLAKWELGTMTCTEAAGRVKLGKYSYPAAA